MIRQEKIVIAGAGGGLVLPDKALLREVRGSVWRIVDPRFYVIAFISIAIHIGLVYWLHTIKVRPAEMVVLEKIPDRFVRLIVEKPIPKEVPKTAQVEEAGPGKEEVAKEAAEEEKAEVTEEKKKVRKEKAKKSVAARQTRVEEKIRTVGVLGMLTGVGTTAKGPSVVDVLGSTGRAKERSVDLEKALDGMSGLNKAVNTEVLNRKLVKSKEVHVQHKESIDDLIAGVMPAETARLEKIGDFIIKPPESIEGAGSTNAKRATKAISNVVASKRSSIRMTYEKYLKRNPKLAGKITVRYTIAASGAVTKVEILENTTGDSALAQDIVRRVKMWRFEPVPEGDVTVTYPFVFQPA